MIVFVPNMTMFVPNTFVPNKNIYFKSITKVQEDKKIFSILVDIGWSLLILVYFG